MRSEAREIQMNPTEYGPRLTLSRLVSDRK